MAAGDIPRGDPALATVMALGLMVQPEVFRIYGRLDRPPSAHSGAIAAAILRAVAAPPDASEKPPY